MQPLSPRPKSVTPGAAAALSAPSWLLGWGLGGLTFSFTLAPFAVKDGPADASSPHFRHWRELSLHGQQDGKAGALWAPTYSHAGYWWGYSLCVFYCFVSVTCISLMDVDRALTLCDTPRQESIQGSRRGTRVAGDTSDRSKNSSGPLRSWTVDSGQS